MRVCENVREEVGYRDALESKNLNSRSGRSEGNELRAFYILMEILISTPIGAWKCKFLPY